MRRRGNIVCSCTEFSYSEIGKHSFEFIVLYENLTDIFMSFKRKVDVSQYDNE